MLSLFSAVGLIALLAQTATSLPTLSSFDDNTTGLLSADLGLLTDQLSTLGTDTGAEASFSSLDIPPPSDDAEGLFQSQQLALNVGSSPASNTPPPPPASQDPIVVVDLGCDNKAPTKGKRNTGGGAATAADTSCPAPPNLTNHSPAGGAAQEAPKRNQEGREENSAPQVHLKPIKVKPIQPGSRGDLRLTPSDEVPSNPFGEKDKDPQCPKQYKYTVCGLADPRYDAWANLYTVHDADLVINSGFGYGMLVRPEWKNRAGVAGWTDALEECGPDPRAIYCCNEYLPLARQAYLCEPVARAKEMEKCWDGFSGLPSRSVLTCIENL